MKKTDKSENRRALPLFLVIMLCALALGVVVGLLAVRSDGGSWQGVVTGALEWFFANCSAFLLFALAVSMPTVACPAISRAKRALAALSDDAEDTQIRAIDHTLSVGLNYISIASAVSYFFFAALMCYLREMGPFRFLLGLVSFIAVLVLMMVLQQKLVDLAKRLYPEKRGSIYDPKFQKKWMQSCDEAEKAIIADAALHAYKVTQTLCVALWMLFVLSHMFFETGLLPIFAVSVIWVASLCAYQRKAAQIDKRGLR